MKAIQFDRVGRAYPTSSGEFVAVSDVTLTVAPGEFVAVVGPSGSGKTTLLRMAAGLDQPTTGAVRVGDAVVTGPGPDRAVVFQQFALFPWKTVRQNIAFGLRCKGTSRAKQSEAIAHYVQLIGLQGAEDRFPHQLSGGMQQRVAIARSYAIEPDVLLMDEPFGALDAQTRTVMQEELVRLTRREPRTVLFITHAVDEAVYLADRVVVLARDPGRLREVVEIGSTRDAEGWNEHPIDSVMELPGFNHLRAQVWRLLRDQIRHDD